MLRCAGCGKEIEGNGEAPTYRILAGGKRAWHQGCEPTSFPEQPPKRALMMEQITLDVPDGHLARRFYVHGLGGLAAEARSSGGGDTSSAAAADVSADINVGASQIVLRLLTSYKPQAPAVTAAALFPGHIALWTRESLSDVHARLEEERNALAPALEAFCPQLGPQKEARLVLNADGVPTQLIATCPYGNKFAVSAPVDAPNRPFRVIGQQPGGYAALLALPRVLLTVKHGAASRVHECLTQVLGLASNLEGLDVEGGGEKDPVSCVVVFASGQQLIFEEEREREGGDDQNEGSAAAERGGSDGGGREEQPPSPTKQPSTHRPPPSDDPDGYQITLYVSSPEAFRTAFRGASEHGLVTSDQRYDGAPAFLANAETWSTAARPDVQQFRVSHLACPTTSELAAKLRMTIRSPLHPCFPFPDVQGSIVVPPGFAESLTPLPQPTHPAQPGFVRVPYGRGFFGESAQELARQKQQQQGLPAKPPPQAPRVQLVHASEMAQHPPSIE